MKYIALISIAAALLFAGCSESDNANKSAKLRIGICVPAATHGWTGGVVWCANRAAEKIRQANPDTEVFVATGQNTSEQVDRIENLLARGIDALVVMSQDPGPVTPVCEQAKSQNVYLVVVSNPLEKPIHDLFVNGDNRSFGGAAAKAMGEALNGKGDIVIMEGIPCPINTERVEGFREVLARDYPAIRILDSQPSYWSAEKGLALMENFFQKYPKIDSVWGGDDDVLVGVLQACRESGRKDIRAIIGGGGSKGIVKQLIDNNTPVKATVSYPPQMIEIAAERALAALKNGKKQPDGKKEWIIPSEVINPANAQKHYYPDSVY